jgi:putative transcriptional regulator
MARGAWLHTHADPTVVFNTPADEMWDTAMRSLGINPRDLFTGGGVN